MSTEAWIFMVGLRIFDVGGLIVWLIWFARQKDADSGDGEWDDEWGEGEGPGGGSAPEPPSGPGGPAVGVPVQPWPARRRDHTGDRPPAATPARRVAVPRRARPRTPS